ncbi:MULTISPECIES: hypothetical protein [Arthrobacter]|uniref:Uncharacterized protein n=1 Tax=Arthrobacter terricola TaxID=2547396 RepID=A0A4R5KNZ5_9MICC|nr:MULTISPECIES: hypothetical protein [Arthrobacter]MBT8160956.1 hypothetical protein [Arthrobacter sp. GN70]TDF97296.1 hypothetical protein E1809_07995 [Arthrobacter terricola]
MRTGDFAMLTPLHVTSMVVFGLTMAYWGRYRFPMLKVGGAADERLGKINAGLVATQGILTAVLPLVNGGKGYPLLAVSASELLLAAVAMYGVKRPDVRLFGYAGTGRHADQEAPHRLTTRWPYTLAYMLGYLAWFGYLFTLGVR